MSSVDKAAHQDGQHTQVHTGRTMDGQMTGRWIWRWLQAGRRRTRMEMGWTGGWGEDEVETRRPGLSQGCLDQDGRWHSWRSHLPSLCCTARDLDRQRPTALPAASSLGPSVHGADLRREMTLQVLSRGMPWPPLDPTAVGGQDHSLAEFTTDGTRAHSGDSMPCHL